jgi:hypothetical protein
MNDKWPWFSLEYGIFDTEGKLPVPVSVSVGKDLIA